MMIPNQLASVLRLGKRGAIGAYDFNIPGLRRQGRGYEVDPRGK